MAEYVAGLSYDVLNVSEAVINHLKTSFFERLPV